MRQLLFGAAASADVIEHTGNELLELAIRRRHARKLVPGTRPSS